MENQNNNESKLHSAIKMFEQIGSEICETIAEEALPINKDLTPLKPREPFSVVRNKEKLPPKLLEAKELGIDFGEKARKYVSENVVTTKVVLLRSFIETIASQLRDLIENDEEHLQVFERQKYVNDHVIEAFEGKIQMNKDRAEELGTEYVAPPFDLSAIRKEADSMIEDTLMFSHNQRMKSIIEIFSIISAQLTVLSSFVKGEDLKVLYGNSNDENVREIVNQISAYSFVPIEEFELPDDVNKESIDAKIQRINSNFDNCCEILGINKQELLSNVHSNYERSKSNNGKSHLFEMLKKMGME